MNKALNSFSNWAQENCMPIILKKTFYQVITLTHKVPNINLKLNADQIKTSQEPKYLGMVLDQELSWQKHIEVIARKTKDRKNILKILVGKE